MTKKVQQNLENIFPQNTNPNQLMGPRAPRRATPEASRHHARASRRLVWCARRAVLVHRPLRRRGRRHRPPAGTYHTRRQGPRLQEHGAWLTKAELESSHSQYSTTVVSLRALERRIDFFIVFSFLGEIRLNSKKELANVITVQCAKGRPARVLKPSVADGLWPFWSIRVI